MSRASGALKRDCALPALPALPPASRARRKTQGAQRAQDSGRKHQCREAFEDISRFDTFPPHPAHRWRAYHHRERKNCLTDAEQLLSRHVLRTGDHAGQGDFQHAGGHAANQQRQAKLPAALHMAEPECSGRIHEQGQRQLQPAESRPQAAADERGGKHADHDHHQLLAERRVGQPQPALHGRHHGPPAGPEHAPHELAQPERPEPDQHMSVVMSQCHLSSSVPGSCAAIPGSLFIDAPLVQACGKWSRPRRHRMPFMQTQARRCRTRSTLSRHPACGRCRQCRAPCPGRAAATDPAPAAEAAW